MMTLVVPLSSFAHDGEHKDKEKHEMMEEGSGSSAMKDGKEYKDHAKEKYEEGSGGMKDEHGKMNPTAMEKSKGKGMEKSHEMKRKMEGSKD